MQRAIMRLLLQGLQVQPGRQAAIGNPEIAATEATGATGATGAACGNMRS